MVDRTDDSKTSVPSHGKRPVWLGIPTSTKEAALLLACPDIKQTEKGSGWIDICQLSSKHRKLNLLQFTSNI